MKLSTILTAVFFGAAFSTALTGLTIAVRAQQDKPALALDEKLEDLKRIQKSGEKFLTKKVRLLWAREAYRCGNVDGAFEAWKGLAEEGSLEAAYILALFGEWSALAEDGSRAAQYAKRLFRPGDGTAKACKL